MEKVRGERCVLLKFGELALKGRNRPLFVNALERNLRRLTSDLGSLDAYTGDYVEVALFGARGAELARESLYEDE